MHLTKASVAALRLDPNKTDAIVFDDDVRGFGVRLRASGKKSWVVQYRVGHKQRRLNLGSIERLDSEQARKVAKKALARVTLGHDPQSDKQTARARAVHTLGVIIEEYLAARKPRLGRRTFEEVQRYLRSDWKPLHELALHDIKRADVAARLKSIANSSGAVTADRARASLSAMYNWAIRDGRVDLNPVAGTNKYAGKIERDRVLTDDELVAIWDVCGDDEYGRIVRLLMFVPARRTEVGDICWSELESRERRWTLPANRSKNHRQITTPLPDQAWDLLNAVPRRIGRDLIFGRGKGGFSGWSRSKARLDARMLEQHRRIDPKAQPIEWRLHDLRRTCATRLAEMGVQPHVIEELLNHVNGHKAGVAGVYNRATYEPEKRAALMMWAERLTALVNGQSPKVVALRGR
jgi:integrase